MMNDMFLNRLNNHIPLLTGRGCGGRIHSFYHRFVPAWGKPVSARLQALKELPNRKITDIITDKLSKTELRFWEQIAGYMDRNGEITNCRAQLLTNKSAVSVKKYLTKFVKLGILKAEGKNKGRKQD